jgi:glycosyltransferase involved in cell wall biosynthesis
MRVLILNVAAESSGALSILLDFYNEIKNHNNKNIKWIFLTSVVDLEKTENIEISKFPWIKKSWIHRIYFESIYLRKIIKMKKIDSVFSLQNVIIPNLNINQILYVHNSLPFVEYKFNIFKNMKLWIYQNVISIIIKKSIFKADHVITQTNWMKDYFVNNLKVDQSKITVIPPKINVDIEGTFDYSTIKKEKIFFYPASAIDFKNHKIIIQALLKLNSYSKSYSVLFTLNGEENKNIKKLKAIVDNLNLNVDFIGQISRQEVFKLYQKSILLFPSFVESSPLPLSEAIIFGTPIISSNREFALEILKDYRNSIFFNPFDSEQLKNIIQDIIENRIKFSKNLEKKYEKSNSEIKLIDYIIKFIEEKKNNENKIVET